MFKLLPLLLDPDSDIGAAGAIDDTPIADVSQDAPPADPPAGDTPPAESAEDVVNAALDKLAPPADEEPAKEAAPAAKQDAAPAAPQGDQPPAEDMYRIPSGLNGEARARFKALSDHARTLDSQIQQRTQEYERVSQRLTGFESIIRDAQATPEVLNGHLQYIKACATGNLEAALQFIESERAALARAMGRPLEGVDILEDFPDLRQRVDSLSLSEEDAHEIARLRREQQAQQRQQQTQAQRQQAEVQQAQYMERINKAKGDIDAWVQQQAKSIDWPHFEAAVVRYIQGSSEILRNTPPEHWLANLKAHYDSLHQVAKAQQTQRTAPGPARGPAPLRPSSAGGRMTTEPNNQSPLDAVNARLGYAT